MRVAVIINPMSGLRSRRDAADVRREVALRALAAYGADADVRVTERRGHATSLAHEAVARGVDLVCAWGGDGTLNEVASALAFTNIPLAVVPAGSGNGLARELRVPVDPAEAFRVAVEGRDRRLDAGELNGRLFFNIAGVGFDALVAHRFATHPRRGFGPYLAIAARELWAYRPIEYELIIDGRPTRARALMIVAANSRQYGNGAIIAPSAQPDDGLLDLVIVEHRSVVGTLVRARHLFRGTLDRCSAVSMQRMASLIIGNAIPLVAHLDGEPFEIDGPLTIRVRPQALVVRC